VAGKLLKTWFLAKDPRLEAVAKGLNELGTWMNTFGAVRPLVAQPVPDGVKLRWQPWESPFVHPWRVSPGAEGKVNVAGGKVNPGATLVTVVGLTNVPATNGRKVWLRVKYYNDPMTPDEAELVSGSTAFPESDYEADVLPDPSDPLTLPQAGWAETILPVAEIVNGELRQYLYETVLLPKGLTQTTVESLGHRWNGSYYEDILVAVTYVRGVRTAMGTPWAVQLFDTALCEPV
jgi:hypothetical protein